MTSYQPTQAEQIVLDNDVDEYVLMFNTAPKSLIVQVRDKNGVDKNIKVNGNVISSNGKVVLKSGDVISYIAVM